MESHQMRIVCNNIEKYIKNKCIKSYDIKNSGNFYNYNIIFDYTNGNYDCFDDVLIKMKHYSKKKQIFYIQSDFLRLFCPTNSFSYTHIKYLDINKFLINDFNFFDIEYMFFRCELKYLNLYIQNIENSKHNKFMFDCSKNLKYVNFKNEKFYKKFNIHYMYECNSIICFKCIYKLSRFNVHTVLYIPILKINVPNPAFRFKTT